MPPRHPLRLGSQLLPLPARGWSLGAGAGRGDLMLLSTAGVRPSRRQGSGPAVLWAGLSSVSFSLSSRKSDLQAHGLQKRPCAAPSCLWGCWQWGLRAEGPAGETGAGSREGTPGLPSRVGWAPLAWIQPPWALIWHQVSGSRHRPLARGRPCPCSSPQRPAGRTQGILLLWVRRAFWELGISVLRGRPRVLGVAGAWVWPPGAGERCQTCNPLRSGLLRWAGRWPRQGS